MALASYNKANKKRNNILLIAAIAVVEMILFIKKRINLKFDLRV
jgi:hypothetical protein